MQATSTSLYSTANAVDNLFGWCSSQVFYPVNSW